MQYLYGKVDTKMNEVFETVAEVLEELRSEAGEREYSVCTKEAENAAKELKKANQEYEKLLAEIPPRILQPVPAFPIPLRQW